MTTETTTVDTSETPENRVADPLLRDGPVGLAVVGLVVALAIALLYGKTLEFPLLTMWDDHLYVTDQTALLTPTAANFRYWFTTGHASNFIPLTMLSFMADYQLWGLNPIGYRLQNLVWFWATAMAVFGCLKGLRVRPRWALGLVLLYVSQATRLESVVWVSERKDVLAGALYFAAIWAYLHRRERDPKAPVLLLLPVVLAALSGLAKGMAIMLPAVLALYEWQRGLGPRQIVRRLWPLAVVGATILGLTLWAQTDAAEEGVAMGRRFLVVARNLLWYSGMGLLPIGQRSALTPRILFTPGYLAAIAGIYAVAAAALALLAWRLGPRARRSLIAGVLALPAIMLPVLGAVPIGAIDYADRYSYFSTPLILLGLGVLLQRLAGRSRARTVSVGAVLACLIVVSVMQQQANVAQWNGDRALMQHAADVPRPNPNALHLLMSAQAREGAFDEALATADRLRELTEGDGLEPHHLAAYRMLADYQAAMIHIDRGRWSVAEPILIRLIEQQHDYSDPEFPSVAQLEIQLGDVYLEWQRPDLALKAYDRAERKNSRVSPELEYRRADARNALEADE